MPGYGPRPAGGGPTSPRPGPRRGERPGAPLGGVSGGGSGRAEGGVGSAPCEGAGGPKGTVCAAPGS